MANTQSIPWRRIGAESAAIVASILFAFAIDAWWDDRQSAADERVFLESLLEDLENKQLRLGNDRKYNEAILEAVNGLLSFASNPDLGLSEEAIDQMIADTWWYNIEASWDSAPMRTLGGGSSSVISNPELLQKLGELQVSISRIRNFYEIDENFHHNVYTPYLIAHADLAKVASEVEHMPGRPEVSYSYPDPDLLSTLATQDHAQLIRQREFQNMLVAKMDRVIDILQNAHRSVDNELDEAIVALRNELND